MSIDYIEITVRQTIPADCLAGIERWLLILILRLSDRLLPSRVARGAATAALEGAALRRYV